MNKSINVQGSEINIINNTIGDFISLTDITKGFEDGFVLVEKWLRNKNTIEFMEHSHIKILRLNLEAGLVRNSNFI